MLPKPGRVAGLKPLFSNGRSSLILMSLAGMAAFAVIGGFALGSVWSPSNAALQCSSLGAANSAAEWCAVSVAEQAANYSWWQMVLSGAGVIGLIVTLSFNAGALRLAREANENALSVGRAQARGYLTIKDVTAYIDRAGQVTIGLTVVNSGASPIRSFIWTVRATYVMPNENISWSSTPDYTATSTPIDIPMGAEPTSSMSLNGTRLSESAVSGMVHAKRWTIAAELTFRWHDVFDLPFEESRNYGAEDDGHPRATVIHLTYFQDTVSKMLSDPSL